jgi:hypothetical protein
MRDVIGLFSLLSLAVAIMLLASGVEKLHRYAVLEMLRLADEMSGLRHQLREMGKDCLIADFCFAPVLDSDSGPAADRSFDAWMRDRTERAHREFMARTSHLPPCIRRTYSADEIAQFYRISLGGID